MKFVRRIAIAVVAIYAVLALALFVLQRNLVFMPRAPEQPALSGSTLIRTKTADGLPVVALYVPAAPGHMTVVHFHGNADQLSSTVAIGYALHELGLGFYAVEYPGYGLAAGASPTEQNLYAVADAALQQLHDTLHVPAGQIMLQGHSLGTGVAAEMATRHHGGKLVLVSPYTSMLAMADRVAPMFPNRFMLRDRFDTLSKRDALTLPILVIHGTQDAIVPVAMGRALAAAIPGARYVEDAQSGHNDIFAMRGYADLVARFTRGELP